MQRSWCPAAAAALILATASCVSAAPYVSIELPAPRSAPGAGPPAVLLIRDVAVPLAGGTVTVQAHSRDLPDAVRLATLFVVGGNAEGTRQRSLRAAVQAPPSVVETIAGDAHATVTLTVCPKGRADACVTSGPFPLKLTHRTD
jgi:hypothetical protein